jgi:hypothetical protein
LVIFGVLTVLGGCFCALFVPLILVAPRLAAGSGNPPSVPHSTLPTAIMYAALAVASIWLGIGSIMVRRWARALLAVWSWSCLVIGFFALVMMAFMAPRFGEAMSAARPPGQPELSQAARSGAMVVMFVVMGTFFVLLPLVWALFYSGKNVKATCEARDPVTRWTDRCPLPVLAASLWIAFGALMMLLVPAYGSVAPFFGILLSGAAGIAFYILIALVWAYCAWAIYHLNRRGWWVYVVTLVLFCVSSVITYSRHDLSEVYATMGHSTEQITAIQKLALSGGFMVWSSLLFTLPILAYLLYIRKFFPEASQQVTG